MRLRHWVKSSHWWLFSEGWQQSASHFGMAEDTDVIVNEIKGIL